MLALRGVGFASCSYVVWASREFHEGGLPKRGDSPRRPPKILLIHSKVKSQHADQCEYRRGDTDKCPRHLTCTCCHNKQEINKPPHRNMSSTLRSALGNSNPNLGQTFYHMPARTQNGKIQARTESVPPTSRKNSNSPATWRAKLPR